MSDVLIAGGGLAACCCAALLSKAGFKVFVKDTERHASPVLMLSEQTQKLLRDVFDSDDFLKGAATVTRRIVAWGQDSEIVGLPHSAVVVPETDLLDRLWSAVPVQPGMGRDYRNVFCGRQSLPAVTQCAFGSRLAKACSVALEDNARTDACWIEATKNGWLFLVPAGKGTGGLIGVGGPVELLLEESRLVASQINETCAPAGVFPAYPRIITPLGGEGWIACGSAAISFDPIAGEGAGHAVRQAILASAVIKGGLDNELQAHYRYRMLGGFLRHLHECARFYSMVKGDWWGQELAQIKTGILWAEEELRRQPPANFRLNGFDLERISS